MSNIGSTCWVTGAGCGRGNRVSHSNIKTHRKFRRNVQIVSARSAALGKVLRKPISVHTLRTILKYGSLDAYLVSRRAAQLSPEALRWRNSIRKALSSSAKEAAQTARTQSPSDYVV